MMMWLTENIGTLAVGLALLAIVAAAIAAVVRDRKKGKSSCGGGCGHCPMGDACHKH